MDRRGFSLVELLMCISILSLLAGLLFPAVQAARHAAREAECRHNLHEIGVDLHSRMGSSDRIPDFMEGPHYFECPEHAAVYGRHAGPYFQICAHDRIPFLANLYDAPLERIVVVCDLYPIHHETRLAVFLDGHVGTIGDFDVGYDSL